MTLGYLGDSGIVLLGGDERPAYDGEGVRWQWGGNMPWSTSPTPRAVTGDNATSHGSWDATRFYGPRRYSLEGLAHAPDHAALHAAEARFMAAVPLRPFNLRTIEPGFDRGGQFRRDGEVLWTEISHRMARFSVPLWAGDPRAYSTETVTASTSFPSSTGGLTWPATWPATWDTDVVNGELALVNEGTETAWPVYRIDGPVVNPRIVNTVTGEQMTVSITLLAGEWLTVDTGSHRVLGNGDPAAARRNLFTGTFFGLAPGDGIDPMTTTIRFDGLSAGPGAALSTSYSHTWI